MNKIYLQLQLNQIRKSYSTAQHMEEMDGNKLTSFEAMLVWNYDQVTEWPADGGEVKSY